MILITVIIEISLPGKDNKTTFRNGVGSLSNPYYKGTERHYANGKGEFHIQVILKKINII